MAEMAGNQEDMDREMWEYYEEEYDLESETEVDDASEDQSELDMALAADFSHLRPYELDPPPRPNQDRQRSQHQPAGPPQQYGADYRTLSEW